MGALTLHYHPLSSYCQKALIAIDLLDADVELQQLDFGNPDERAAFTALWPTGKIPLLVDDGRPVPETSILIEHLQRHHARSAYRLIPEDPDAALQVRLWDRLFDVYVMTPMQAHTADLLRQPAERDPLGVAQARDTLLMAYGMIDRQLAGKTWITGDQVTLADCAAAPSLFYARAYVPVPGEHARLVEYFERLVAHPSVAKTIDGARPWYRWFPGRAALETRFFDPAAN